MSSGSSLEFLFSLERFGMKFGLANMARLTEALAHPEAAFHSVLVAGTNGKGSVTAMVDTALRAAGHRSARYTSPHLVRLEERFVIDGREVDTATLSATADRVRQAAEHLVATGALQSLPTFFECTTALAFEVFRDAGVEIAVLEVGLGGRLDATNIVTPVVGAIVSIDFDHQAQLGTTLPQIAAEKAGIVKPGIPLVCGALPPEALAVVAQMCRDRDAPLIRAGEDAALAARIDAIPLALRGAHQARNAAVAVKVLEQLDARGVQVGQDAVYHGLTHTVWPARLEEFQAASTRVLVDAAHNPAGARALADYVRATAPEGVTLVFGAMRDKAVGEMLGTLAPISRHTICTTAASPRALDATTVADEARRAGHAAVEAVLDPADALKRALSTGRTVVVAGSIFLAGPLRERLARGILR